MTDATDRDFTIETRFGPVSRSEARELAFPLGLPGFEGVERFLLAPIPGACGPLYLLHGPAREPVELVVVAAEALPEPIAPGDIEATRESLEIPAADLLVLCVVALPPRGSGRAAHANLRAPIFVDVARRLAVQVVLKSQRYPFRAPLRAA